MISMKILVSTIHIMLQLSDHLSISLLLLLFHSRTLSFSQSLSLCVNIYQYFFSFLTHSISLSLLITRPLSISLFLNLFFLAYHTSFIDNADGCCDKLQDLYVKLPCQYARRRIYYFPVLSCCFITELPPLALYLSFVFSLASSLYPFNCDVKRVEYKSQVSVLYMQ